VSDESEKKKKDASEKDDSGVKKNDVKSAAPMKESSGEKPDSATVEKQDGSSKPGNDSKPDASGSTVTKPDDFKPSKLEPNREKKTNSESAKVEKDVDAKPSTHGVSNSEAGAAHRVEPKSTGELTENASAASSKSTPASIDDSKKRIDGNKKATAASAEFSNSVSRSDDARNESSKPESAGLSPNETIQGDRARAKGSVAAEKDNNVSPAGSHENDSAKVSSGAGDRPNADTDAAVGDEQAGGNAGATKVNVQKSEAKAEPPADERPSASEKPAADEKPPAIAKPPEKGKVIVDVSISEIHVTATTGSVADPALGNKVGLSSGTEANENVGSPEEVSTNLVAKAVAGASVNNLSGLFDATVPPMHMDVDMYDAIASVSEDADYETRQDVISSVQNILKPKGEFLSRAELLQASKQLRKVMPYNFEAWRLHADILLNALRQLETRQIMPDESFRILAIPLRENDIRDAAEAALRQCAHFAHSEERRIQLVDEANSVRRLTWF
jgi:hypothetical protein